MYKLLIVDDESIVRRGIKKCIDFQIMDIEEVYEAENGEEALRIVSEKEIDIVLADINMPRMNGLDFAKKVKAQNQDIKIAFITGYDYFDYAVNALKIGVDDYILKPVSKVDIIEIISGLIEKKKADKNIQAVKEAVIEITRDLNVNRENDYKEVISEIINNNISNSEFSLNTLALELGFSVGYLSTLFKSLFGINFREYLLNIRLERAKILLLSTPMKNYEIASAIGIEDPNYFSACFKKRYKLTTKKFKAQAGQIK